MEYKLVKDLVEMVERFASESRGGQMNLASFSTWLSEIDPSHYPSSGSATPDLTWEGKENGRSPESIINTLLVHMYRYARLYGKAVIANSPFTTSDEFIYLINLKFAGKMSKTALIKRNIHEKPTGVQIINRLIKNGWATQSGDPKDKRNKIISITDSGNEVLEHHMQDIRRASKVVTGNLTHEEQMQLIGLLLKLEDFHNEAYLNDKILNSFSGE